MKEKSVESMTPESIQQNKVYKKGVRDGWDNAKEHYLGLIESQNDEIAELNRTIDRILSHKGDW